MSKHGGAPRNGPDYLIVVLLALGSGAWAHAAGGDYPANQAVKLEEAPAGLNDLVNSKGRVHGFDVSGDHNFFFAGDTAAFQTFLERYSRLEGIAGRRLIVRKGKGHVKSLADKGAGKACDWILDAALVTWRDYHVWGENCGEVLRDEFGGTPRKERPGYLAEVLVWADGNIELAKVMIPDGIGVIREDRVSLVLRPRAGHEAAVGRPLDLVFVLRNLDTKDFVFLEDFCPLHIVHEVTCEVTEPDGTVLPNVVRISVGGPAFLGGGRGKVIGPGKEAELPCSQPDAEEQPVWSPVKAGSHKVVARYRLPVPSTRSPSPVGDIPDYVVIVSEPLSIDVARLAGKQGAAGTGLQTRR